MKKNKKGSRNIFQRIKTTISTSNESTNAERAKKLSTPEEGDNVNFDELMEKISKKLE